MIQLALPTAPASDLKPELPAHAVCTVASVATTREQVLDAWGLVHQVYAHADLIDPNPFNIHTSSQAASSQAAVLFSGRPDHVSNTITAIADGPAGLPLDQVYRIELDMLRRSGRRLVEIGLFGDARVLRDRTLKRAKLREDLARSFPAMARLGQSLAMVMGLAVGYAQHQRATDLVIGVHPHHVCIHRRLCGFLPHAAQRSYPNLKHRPVVLMRCPLDVELDRDNLPDGLNYLGHCMRNPAPAEVFDQRYQFHPNDPLINAYLQSKDAIATAVA